MVEQTVSLNMLGVLSRANAASNALVTPETSRFLREILEKALANPVGVAPRWVAETWALLANVLVNDYLPAGTMPEDSNSTGLRMRCRMP
jgi:hypothetical protein